MKILILSIILLASTLGAVPFKNDVRNNRENSFVVTEAPKNPHFRTHVGKEYANNYFHKKSNPQDDALINFFSKGYWDTRCVRAHGGRSNGYCGRSLLINIPPVIVDIIDDIVTGRPPNDPTDLVVIPVYDTVPDVGSTAAMLGLTFFVIFFIRRKF